MSVILNALRSKEAAKAAQEKMGPKEGLFFGVPRTETRSFGSRISVLLIILFAASIFAFVRFAFHTEAAPSAQPLSEMALPKAGLAAKPAVDLAGAKALFAQNRLDESLKAYEQLLKAAPANALLMNDMGLILLKQGRVLEAEGRFQSAIKSNPQCAECYNNLGLLATQSGRLVDAEQSLKTAIALKAGYADPYFNLGVVYEKLGEPVKAIASFHSFLKVAPASQAAVVSQVKNHIASMTEAAQP